MPLHAAIADLRRRLRRMVIVRGICSAAAVILGVLLVAAGVDALVHVDHPETRFVVLLGTAALAAIVVRRRLVRPLAAPWDDASLALLVERLVPAWRDRLASAVQFESAGRLPDAEDTETASLALRCSAVREARPIAAGLRSAALIDGRGALAAIGVFGLVCVAVAAWFAAAPAQALLAFERQLAPFSAAEWPRSTQLALLDEDLRPLEGSRRRLIAGEPLTFYVANLRGAVPEDVRVERRSTSGQTETVGVTPTSLRGTDGRERLLAVATIVPEEGRLELGAIGGDDLDRQWHAFDVVAPPRIERFRLRIEPPAYSGLPETVEERGVGHVEGLVGSRVTIEGEANAELSRATLRRDGEPSVELPLEADPRRFLATFDIASEGRSSYSIDLADATGIAAPRAPRYEIRGRADRPPSINLHSPAPQITATPQAQLPLAADCVDDLGLADVALVYTVPTKDLGEQRQPLWLRGATASEGPTSESYQVRSPPPWDLGRLGLEPGTTVEYWIEARDSREPEPQIGRSRSQTIAIVTPEEKRREIQGYQTGLARLLTRLDARQAEAHQQTRDLLTQWTAAGALRPEDGAALDRIDLERRRLLGDLTDSHTGLVAQTQRVARELEWNLLDDPATLARMARLAAQGTLIVEQFLPELSRGLASIRAEAGFRAEASDDASRERRDAGEASSDLSALLADAEHQQAAISGTLRAMLDELLEWRQQYDATQQLEELLAGQREIHNATAEVGRRTLAKPLAALSGQERADLSRTADRQRRMADDVQRLRELVAATQTGGLQEDPGTSEAGSFSHVGARLREGRVEALSQQAAGQIAANRIGEALQTQQRILRHLEQTVQEVAGASAGDVAQLLAAIRQTQDEMEGLRKRQNDARQRLQSLGPLSQSEETREQLEVLRKEQQELAQETESLAVRLRRQQLNRAANSTTRAASGMREADRSLESRQGERAAAAQEETLDDLLQAERELAEAARAAEQRRVIEQLAALATQVRTLEQDQHLILDETQALEGERRAAGRRSRAALKQLNTLAERQHATRKATIDLAGELEEIELIRRVLERAGGEMQISADGLAARDTGTDVTTAQQSALDRLASLLAVAEASPAQPPSESSTAEQPAEADVADQAARGMQLRLLRTLQADLLARTEAVRQQWQGGASAELEEAVARLAEEQAELAGLAEKLLALPEESGPGPGTDP